MSVLVGNANDWFNLAKALGISYSAYRHVTIFQESARNHFREAGIVMQSYMVENVHQPFRNNACLVCTPENDFYVNYKGQRSPSAFFLIFEHGVFIQDWSYLRCYLS